MNSNVDQLDAAHSQQWADSLQDAVDGNLSATELTALSDHLGNCDVCRSEYRALQSLDATLSSRLGAPVLSGDFDNRLMAHISTLEDSLLTQAREQEQREHLARVARLQGNWRSFWHFNLGNMLGCGALLAALVTALAPESEAHPIVQMLQQSAGISPFLLIMAAIATTWALRGSERTA